MFVGLVCVCFGPVMDWRYVQEPQKESPSATLNRVNIEWKVDRWMEILPKIMFWTIETWPQVCWTVRKIMTHCIFRVEDVRGRRVVYNDDFSELSAQPAEVFDVISPVENTWFPEEPSAKHPPLVQQVCHGVSILTRAKRKEIIDVAMESTTVPNVEVSHQPTLAKLAVKRTHSNNSPIFWRNSSTWGLFKTYT